MKDYISIGSSPYDESCAQVGSDNYYTQSKAEGIAFIKQLLRIFGEPPEGAKLSIKYFPHDFGTYTEVVCYYDDEYPDSVDYAFKIESNSPALWDTEAQLELMQK